MARAPVAQSPEVTLREAADIFEERNEQYGDSYHRIGELMIVLFPNGITLRDANDFNRFCVAMLMVSKIDRYFANYDSGGHRDSLVDNAVYSTMLAELDQIMKMK